MVLMPGFQSTRLVTEGALEPFFFLYTDDSIQGNPETCKQSSIMLNYEVKNHSNSNRYGQEIADVLTKLRTDCNSIYSTKGELNIKPTLLVYDDNSRENVVGAFIQESGIIS